MLEAEYRRHFKLIEDQITGATRAFYTYVEINKFASDNNDNYQKISKGCGFCWLAGAYRVENPHGFCYAVPSKTKDA
jgi:hypothetical protein